MNRLILALLLALPIFAQFTPPLGGPPAGALHEIQTNGGAGTLAGSNWFANFGDLINGNALENANLPMLSPATNSLFILPSQNLATSFNLVAAVPGGHGADASAFNISALATVDSATAYFDSQIGFGASGRGVGATSSNPYVIGAEGVCTSTINCSTFSSYDFFLINSVTGNSLLINTSASPNQLSVPAVTQFATLGNYVAAGPIISNDATDSNPFSLSKNAIADAAPGAGYVSFKAVAGTNAGTCKVVMKAGTSTTPVTLIDNIGGSC